MSSEADSGFDERAAATLSLIEAAVDSAGFEIESPSAGILEIEFDDGSKMVINRHAAAREIWVAARSGGFHFRRDGETWVDTRSGEELLGKLEKLIASQAGRDFRFG